MPRTAKQFQAMQEESREAIIEAGLTLFAVHGFTATSVAMIAQKAGISQGLMYNYFASKEDLLRAIFERGWRDVQASFILHPPQSGERLSLYDFIENACRLTLKHQDFWRLINTLRGQQAIMEKLHDDIARFEIMIRQQLEIFCRASYSPNPQAEAVLLFSLIDGICMHLVRHPEAYPLEEVLLFLKPQYQARLL